jgi:hypothetical protein
MANMLHGCARTTPRIRAELQRSQKKTKCPGAALWAEANDCHKVAIPHRTADAPMGPTKPKSTVPVTP